MKIVLKKWNNIDDVPKFKYEWAKLVGGKNITIDEVNDLILSYEEYLSKRCDIEQLDPTTD